MRSGRGGSCMAGAWDSKLKLLINKVPQDFVSWLVEGAIYEEEISPHLKTRNIDADVLYRISMLGRPYLLHIEFQLRSKPEMAERMWEYNVLATRRNNLPVYSFVVYLKKGGKVVESPYTCLNHNGDIIHHFNFGVIKLWEIPTAQLKNLGLKGLLPLLPLTSEGKNRAVVEEVITELSGKGKNRQTELLSLTYGLASLIFRNEDDQNWLRRRFGMLDELLDESWAFQEILQRGQQKGLEQGLGQGLEQGLKQGLKQGLEQGLEQGLAQGREQGLEQGIQKSLDLLRQMVITLVENLYPALVPLAKKKVGKIADQSTLQNLILQVSLAKQEAKAREYFEE
jgi:predicted transposase YdaD